MMRPIATMTEVLDVLQRHPQIRVVPDVAAADDQEGLVTLTLTTYPMTQQDALEAVALYDDLKYLADVAQLRAFAAQYGIDAARLEALLPSRDVALKVGIYAAMMRQAPPDQRGDWPLTSDEVRHVVAILEDEHLLLETEQDQAVDAILPKLRALLEGQP